LGREARVHRVALNRKLSGRTLVLTLLLCWPLLLFGRPAYFADTLGYFHGGQTATAFLVRHFQPSTSSQTGSPTSRDEHDTRAARSIPYSVLAFGLRGADDAMTPLAALQALLTAFTVTVFLGAAPVSDRRYWATAAVLALATPAPWVSSFAMPDHGCCHAQPYRGAVGRISRQSHSDSDPVGAAWGVVGRNDARAE
jgi:hypothetical protein